MKQKCTGKVMLWLLLTMIAAVVMFLFTIGPKPITNLNSNFTSNGGDALKDVFFTYYNAKYDTSYVRNNAMNYPYGDHYTYTGCQTFVSWPLHLADNLGLGDYSGYVTGLVNFFIFISVFLCVLFLFLLFNELKLPYWVSAIGAVVVTFLSPQMGRLPAHLTLSYSFFIPLILYLFLKFYREPKIKYCVFQGITLFLCGLVHPYYVVFFAVIFGMFWLYVLISEREKFGKTKVLIPSLLLQFVLPLVSFFSLTKIGDVAADRTNLPWGFFEFRGRIEGLIFPYGRTYFHRPDFLSDIQWEAISYVGVIATVGFIGIVVVMLKRLFTGKFLSALRITKNNMLNLFFWSSVLLMLAAMLLPLLPVRMLNYFGPLAQMRAIARFMWLFYYVINVVVIYLATEIVRNRVKSTILKAVIVAVIVFSYGFESYKYAAALDVENDFPEIFDYENELAQNEWVNSLDGDQFQSILALPYFHIGTEHIWLEAKDDMLFKSVYVSMKTGLPVHNNQSARSCINQAYKNLAFTWEPYRSYPILSDMRSDKPILTIKKSGENSLNQNECRIIDYSSFLFSANGLDFYKTELDSLRKLCDDYSYNLYRKCRNNKLFPKTTSVYSNDTLSNFYFQGWDTAASEICFQGDGALSGMVNKRNELYFGNQPVVGCDSVEISFLMGNNYTGDLFGRTSIEVYTADKNLERKGFYLCTDAFRVVENVFDGWGLVRVLIPVSSDYEMLSVSVENKIMLEKPVFFDNLTIKPIGLNVVNESKEMSTLNNVPVIYQPTDADKMSPVDTVIFELKPVTEKIVKTREEQIREMVEQIRQSPEWLNDVKKKAEKKDISLDSMLVLDAVYMIDVVGKQ